MLFESLKEKDQEKPIAEMLPLISKFINRKYKIIKNINKLSEYYDDPKFFHFAATLEPISTSSEKESLSNGTGGYSFFSEDEALLKCIGESLERYSLRVYDKNRLIKGSYSELKDKALNPKQIISFSQSQINKPGFEIFNFDSHTPFGWVKGLDLTRSKKVLIPAQLAYLSYHLAPQEKWIYLPITTGAAGGGSITSSIVRGIYEVIEREAFIIFYLNKLSGKKIDIQSLKDSKIKFCIDIIKSYNLEVNVIDITTDLGIPTFLAIILDKTGIGPAINLGLRTNLNSNHAILGSIQEALHPRSWIRRKVEDNPRLLKKTKIKHIVQLEDRALLWYNKTNIEKLRFFLDQKVSKPRLYEEQLSFFEQLNILLKRFIENQIDIYSVDVTPEIIKKTGYYVFKTIIPQLHPFYLLEDFPYHGGTRLYNLPKKLGFTEHETTEDSLNMFPHPFL